MESRKGGIRNLSMKKFGTPMAGAPGWASEKEGMAGVGTPPLPRSLGGRMLRMPGVPRPPPPPPPLLLPLALPFFLGALPMALPEFAFDFPFDDGALGRG